MQSKGESERETENISTSENRGLFVFVELKKRQGGIRYLYNFVYLAMLSQGGF